MSEDKHEGFPDFQFIGMSKEDVERFKKLYYNNTSFSDMIKEGFSFSGNTEDNIIRVYKNTKSSLDT